MVHVKNIFKIFAGDIKRIALNPVAVIIALGLTLIPALYAWFNIAASWDLMRIQRDLRLRLSTWIRGLLLTIYLTRILMILPLILVK